MADSALEGHVGHSSVGHYLASPAKTMEAVGLAPQWDSLLTDGLSSTVVDTIVNARLPSMGWLYLLKFK